MKTTDDRRAQFDAECRSAGLTLGARDYDLLYDMWLDWLPERDRLRATMPEPEDEPWRRTSPSSLCAEGAKGPAGPGPSRARRRERIFRTSPTTTGTFRAATPS